MRIVLIAEGDPLVCRALVRLLHEDIEMEAVMEAVKVNTGFLVALDNIHRQETDKELMVNVSLGRTDALETLYDRHALVCFGLAMKIVHDPTVAEEVVQDVFVKLWSRPSLFAPERGNFSAWLLTLVRNRSVDKLRRVTSWLAWVTTSLDGESRSGSPLAEVLADTSPSLDDLAWARERAEIVRSALRCLPEPQGLAITLAYYGGLTQNEIAIRLQEPLSTIKSRTRAGLQRLRKLLVGVE